MPCFAQTRCAFVGERGLSFNVSTDQVWLHIVFLLKRIPFFSLSKKSSRVVKILYYIVYLFIPGFAIKFSSMETVSDCFYVAWHHPKERPLVKESVTVVLSQILISFS